MADIVDAGTRSRMMSRIRGKDTAPELALRKALHARGLRYRVHARHLAGRPDLVLPRYDAVVLVHGCFWHRHEGCRYATVPSTRSEFWQKKFETNRHRDRDVFELLRHDNWRVATVWECALRRPEQVATAAEGLVAWLSSESPVIILP